MTKTADKKIRVLVVDDSAFMCKVLQGNHQRRSAARSGRDKARDGRDAVALAESLRPDVITMDINMPHVDGLQATELIMSQHPRPIVIVSSESREGAASTLRALELGAIDFVPKPSSGIDLDMKNVREELTRKLKMAAKVRVVRTATRSKLPASATRRFPVASAAAASIGASPRKMAAKFPIVVIAASTGGPAAVMRVVAGLPKDFPRAVFLVLHMPAAFTKQFTVQLAEISPLARERSGARTKLRSPGVIYLCPGSHHLRLSSTRKNLAGSRRANRRISPVRRRGVRIDCRLCARDSPSAWCSPAWATTPRKACRPIKAAGGYVIAQDEATSVIFGMPAEAIKTGVVDEVLPLDDNQRGHRKARRKTRAAGSGGSAMKIAAQETGKVAALAPFRADDSVFASRIRCSRSLPMPCRKFAARTAWPAAANEIEQSEIPKVRHTLERSHRTYYVVNAGAHFGLPVTRPTLVLILRQLRVAVLVDRIERMAEISAVSCASAAHSRAKNAAGIAA